MDASYTNLLVGFLFNTALLAGVPLAVATVLGLVVSFFQAVTQIQDQTLGQTIKIIAIIAVFLIFGALLITPFIENTRWIFSNFGSI